MSVFGVSEQEVQERVIGRFEEQERWNDVFSTRLIEILDNVDKVKGEIRARLRQTEQVAKAEGHLLEKAAEMSGMTAELESARNGLLEVTGRAGYFVSQLASADEKLHQAVLRLTDAKNHFSGSALALEEAREEQRSSAAKYESAAALAERKMQECTLSLKKSEEERVAAAKTYQQAKEQAEEVKKDCAVSLAKAQQESMIAAEDLNAAKSLLRANLKQQIWALSLITVTFIWMSWSLEGGLHSAFLPAGVTVVVIASAVIQLRRNFHES